MSGHPPAPSHGAADLHGVRVTVLTLSDSIARGEHKDASGDILVQTLTGHGAEIAARDVLPDNADRIAERLRVYADELHADLVLTTGGSGTSPHDVTPEATLQVVDRLVPGIVEAARMGTLTKTPLAMLSRSVAGIRGKTLIVNLPGSPTAVSEWLEIILPVLRHAVEVLRGEPRPWGTSHAQKTEAGDRNPGTGRAH